MCFLSHLAVVLAQSIEPRYSSREWRCSWSSANRRCSNYIWVIDNGMWSNVISCHHIEKDSVETALVHVHYDSMKVFDEKTCYVSSVRLQPCFRHCWPSLIVGSIGLTHWYWRNSPGLVGGLFKVSHAAISKGYIPTCRNGNVVYHGAQYWALFCLPRIFFRLVTFVKKWCAILLWCRWHTTSQLT